MHKRERRLVISFASTTMALAMEKKCKEEQMDGRLIPLPKEISAGCGLAWSSGRIEEDFWIQFLLDHQLVYEAIHQLMI